jgi:hypothetical protein
MKFLTPLLCLLFAQGIAIAQEPAELVERRQAWETQRSEAQGKVDKLYFEELEQLKKNFTQADNIAAALAVDNVIKGRENADNEPGALNKIRGARDSSLKKALTPIDKQYWQDLKKLRVDFRQQGKLDGVVAADAEIEKVLAAYKKPEAPKAKNKAPEIDLGDEKIMQKFKVFGNITMEPKVGLVAHGHKQMINSYVITKKKYTFPISVSFRASCRKDGVLDIFSAIFSATEKGGISLLWGSSYNTQSIVHIFGRRTQIPHKVIQADKDYIVKYEISKNRKLEISIDGSVVFEEDLDNNLDLCGPICLSGGIGHVVFKELTIIEKW